MDWFRRNLSPWRNKKNHPKTKKNANNSTGVISATTHGRLDDFINITEGSDADGSEKEKDLMLEKDECSAEENIHTNIDTNKSASVSVIEDEAVFEPFDETEIQNIDDDSTPVINYEQELNSMLVSSDDIVPENEIYTDNSVNPDTFPATNDTSDASPSPSPSTSPSPSSTSPKHQKYPHHPRSKKFLNFHQQREHFRNIVIQQPR